MKMTSVSEAKSHLSALLKMVKHGDTITITEHRRPIALLQPMRLDRWKSHAVLQNLASRGLVQLPQETPDPDAILSLPIPKMGKRKSLLDALREERRTGR